MFSEAGLVGYVYPWIRPPIELYSSLPISNKDGIDATYRFPLGAAADTLHMSYGRTVKKLPDNTEVTVDHSLDVHNTVEYGPTTIRVGYTSFKAKADGPQVAPLVGALTQFSNAASFFGFAAAGQQATSIASNFLKPRYRIATIGASYDPGDWLLMAEWAQLSANAQVFKADSSAWYVTGGYRIAAFTPYLTFAQTKLDKKRLDGIPTAGLPPPLAAGAAGLNAALDGGVSQSTPTQDSVSVGMRWDLKKNVALKMQYDHLRTSAGTNGRLVNAQPGFRSGDTANVVSAAVDFVF
jgi:predicted porin